MTGVSWPHTFNNQVAENAIFDIFGKQVYLGNSFFVASVRPLTDTTEHNVLLVSNPAGNTKSMFVYSRRATGSARVLYKFYGNPTVTVAGTPVTPSNNRSSSTTSSTMVCSSVPTTGPLPTSLSVLASNGASVEMSKLIVIDPGISVLVTAQSPDGSVGTPTMAFFEVIWYEL